MKKKVTAILLIFVFSFQSALASVSPAAVGWGNLLVPGLGATLRGEPVRGLAESVVELGLFYGGTFGVREGQFSIDTTVVLPQRGNLLNPLFGQTLQQFGLKIHMFNSFYNYQQACRAIADSEREINNPQPLYQGSWTDVLAAPFRWENISNPWVYIAILASAAYMAIDYRQTQVGLINYAPSPTEETLYGINQVGIIPLGSAFGEEVAFRGLMQREMHLYTGSLMLAILSQTALFTALHPSNSRVAAGLGGLYFGYLTHRFNGNLEQAIAAHFWIDVLAGFIDYLRFRLSYGKDVPWSPNLSIGFGIPL